MKSKEEEKEIREKRETPIIDGDARPDENERAAKAEKFLAEKEKAGKKLTKERGADINSLEDYKDTK
jgi:hypothetical protein